jgi:uncharacterized protein YkwD
VHHRPIGPRPTARVTGAFTRWGLLLRALLSVRPGRLVLAGVVTTAVTTLMLGLPVVSGLGSETQPLALDASSSTSTSPSAEKGSPVVMGVDGRAIASSSFPGSPASPDAAAPAPGTTGAPAATPEPPDVPEASAPAAGDAAASAGPSTTSAASSAPSMGPSPAGPSSAGPSSAGPSSSGASSHAPSSAPSAPVRRAPVPAEPPASVPPEESAEDDAEEELLELLDEARDDCPSLDVDRSLAAAARAHSAVMRDAGALTPLEGGPAGSIAQGGTYAEDVLDGWLDDPTGRATILDCSRDSVGIGLVEGAGGPWWTLLLA